MRFLTLNLWGEQGPWQQRIALLRERLPSLGADIIAFQEVVEVPGRVPNHAEAMADACGYQYVYAVGSSWEGGHGGLGILSRYPIGAHESQPLPHSTEAEGRIVLSARVDSPIGALWIHNTHLSYREHEGRWREDQVMFIDEVVTAHKNDSPQIVMGDFNAVPHSDEIRWMTGLTTLGDRRVFYQDAWDVLRPDERGYTWARANPYIDRMGWLRGDRRIDYVFVTPPRRDGRGTVRAVRLAFDEPVFLPNGERLFASDHLAVLADVQMTATEGAS